MSSEERVSTTNTIRAFVDYRPAIVERAWTSIKMIDEIPFLADHPCSRGSRRKIDDIPPE